MRIYGLILLVMAFLVSSCGGGDDLPPHGGGSVTGPPPAGGTTVTSGNIAFTLAIPQVIGIKGSGQPETSEITFTVRDTNGDPIPGLTVTFTMSGPNGGEFITPTSATTTSSGAAKTTLNSGSVSGPVTITASVDIAGTTVTSSPAAISIGGGVPSATHFNIAGSRLNLHGFVISGVQATITAFIGDRFNNFNVLEGTSVSFYTEGGAIDRSSTLDAAGNASVTIRTQSPIPEDVVISTDEETTLSLLNTTYTQLGIGAPPYAIDQPHPRDGWVTVLATVQGEEHFDDANGNGVYDLGENFTDLGEPFYDKNDNGVRDDGTGDPFEEFIDTDGDGTYDTPNGVWDGPNCPGAGCRTSKTIWDDIRMQFTGNATVCAIDPPLTGDTPPNPAANRNDIADGGSRIFRFMVSDFNFNTPVSGTKITVKHDGGGKLFGATSYTIPDGISSDPYEISVTVADDDFGDTDGPDFFSIEFEVTSSEVVTCVTRIATGTVD